MDERVIKQDLGPARAWQDLSAAQVASRVMIALYLALASIGLAAYLYHIDVTTDPNGIDRLGRDFVNFWMGGQTAWGGDVAALYDRASYKPRSKHSSAQWKASIIFPIRRMPSWCSPR